MTFAALRVAAAREQFNQPPLTEEEQLMIAPPDEALFDGDVAVAAQEDAVDSVQEDALGVFADAEQAQSVVDAIKGAGESVSAEAVLVAQERLHTIFSRYDLPSRRVAREDFSPAGPFSEAQDLISGAEKNIAIFEAVANEGFAEFAQRVSVNLQNLTRWSSTYAKEASAVAARARQTEGTPSDARYSARVRIAHFCDKNMEPMATAAQYKSACEGVTKTVKGMAEVATHLGSAFNFLFKKDGKVDLRAIFGSLEEVKVGETTGFALSGGAGIYGEEVLMRGVDTSAPTENMKELAVAMSEFEVTKEYYWNIKDLPEDLALPVMDARSVASNAAALVGLASTLVVAYKNVKLINSSVTQNSTSISGLVLKGIADTAANPGLIMLRNKVRTAVNSLAIAANGSIDLVAKGLNCLLDYYKWSLKHHKQVASEGFAGGLTGFILGLVLTPISPVVGAVYAVRASALQKQIIMVAEDIKHLKEGADKDALKRGVMTPAQYKQAATTDIATVIKGAALGLFANAIYTAVQGSRIEDRSERLKELLTELDALVKESKKANKD